MVVILMGASGAGKSTVGRALADELGWAFLDSDDLHAPGSIEKMRRGEGLTDAEREPWLARVRAAIEGALAARRHLIIACSALREDYRTYLSEGLDGVRFVFLDAPRHVLEARVAHRRGHFAATGLIASQLQTLEPPSPQAALVVDASLPVATLVQRIRSALTS